MIPTFDVVAGLAEVTLDVRIRGRSAPHFHSRYAVGIFRDAGATHCRDARWEIKPGDIVVHAPREPHWGEADGECAQDFFYVAPEFLDRTFDAREGFAFRAPVIADAPLAEELSRALRGTPAELERAIERLFATHAVRIDAPLVAAPVDVPLDRPVAELSADAGLSRAHYSRRFLREQGLSPRDFRRQSRVLAACELIAEGVDLAESAQRAGFADQPHMTRQFRSILGITPSAVRRARAFKT